MNPSDLEFFIGSKTAQKSPPDILPSHEHRLAVLDGWRAVSILLVLISHMMPLGPRSWGLVDCTGMAGMGLFFTLSGFLITRSLLRVPSVPSFLIRRFSRIIPLAWMASVVYLLIQHKEFAYFKNTLLFTINSRYWYRTPLTNQFWSLCVEVHFYLGVAALVLFLGTRWLPLASLVGLGITGLRIYKQIHESGLTHHRGDEILSGVTLALIWYGQLGQLGRTIRVILSSIPKLVLIPLFFASCHPASGPLMYARPYFGMSLVGVVLCDPGGWLQPLTSRFMRYVAEISYALYITHSIARLDWLNSGETLEWVLKRPLCIAIILFLAHISTFYFERPCTAIGKRLSRRFSDSQAPSVDMIDGHPINPLDESMVGSLTEDASRTALSP